MPVRFLHASPHHPFRFIACHSLTVAQVIARVLLHDPEWKGRLQEPILAALLHDIGMVRIPAEILSHPGPLNDDQRRRMENHTREGSGVLVPLAPGAPWLIEAAVGHHERSDGTGYPAGLVEMQLSPLVRLVTVCDIYAALCCPRPYRGALEPRTALTDTLLLADQGALDKFQAERLMNLSFYPVGSVVELSDGSTAVVVAAQCGNSDKVDPARPVVALLTDNEGLPTPAPTVVDLTQGDERTVLRRLLVSERRELVGKRYPVLV
jgi:HD-GYP domain-containing protein (c-di-GMP phosphodiesterase class II)